MKTKKTPEPESATLDQASALLAEKKKITRSPEYTEARIKAQLRATRELRAAAHKKFTDADEIKALKIRLLEGELAAHQEKMATDAQPTLL